MEEDSAGDEELMPEEMRFGSHEKHPEKMTRPLGEPWLGKGKDIKFGKNLAPHRKKNGRVPKTLWKYRVTQRLEGVLSCACPRPSVGTVCREIHACVLAHQEGAHSLSGS